MSRLEKVLFAINVIIYSLLTIFSYAYVDLNLTLSQNTYVNLFSAKMQQLGYFHRPIAAVIYLIFIITTFSFFIINLYLFRKSKIKANYLKSSILANTLILVFAYPFLSSDLFNYIFDAKIILNYHVSPYTHRPLDFQNDEWLRFMRWVHRYSPYGPLWLIMSQVPAILGFGKFILNLFTFKVFIGIFHLINSYLIYKIVKKINPDIALFGVAFYAFNPLILIEGVANAHNDVVLASFILAPFYFLVQKKSIWIFLSIIAGTLIKYIPVLNLPWFVWQFWFKKKGGITKLLILNILTMAVFTYLFSSFKITVPFVSSGATQVQFQPWYLFWTIPLISLIPEISLIVIAISTSIGASMRYLPYIYYGDWSHRGTVMFMTLVTIIPFVLSLSLVLLVMAKNKNVKKNQIFK